MAHFLRKDKGASKLINVQHLGGTAATQVLSIYRIINNVAVQIWRYIKGFVYTSDGKAIKFNDGRYLKFKDQQ